MDESKSGVPRRELVKYKKGELILKEGEFSSIIYILMSGVLGVYKDKQKVAEIEGKGVVFGEMSSLLFKPRSTSVIAEEDSEVMVYYGGVQSIALKFPSVLHKIMAQMAERLADMNEKYSQLQAENRKLTEALTTVKTEPPPPSPPSPPSPPPPPHPATPPTTRDKAKQSVSTTPKKEDWSNDHQTLYGPKKKWRKKFWDDDLNF